MNKDNLLQEQVFKDTKAIVSPINFYSILLYSFIYTLVVTIISLSFQFFWYIPIVSFVFFSVYFYLRSRLIYNQTNKQLKDQLIYMERHFPDYHLLLPVIAKRARLYFLRQMAFYFSDSAIILIAYHYHHKSKMIDENVSFILNQDFDILEVESIKDKPLTSLKIKIENDIFTLIVVNNDYYIAQFIKNIQIIKE